MTASRITFAAVLVLLGAIAVAPGQSALVADLATPHVTTTLAADLKDPASVTPVTPSVAGSDHHLELAAAAAAGAVAPGVAVEPVATVQAPGKALDIPPRAVAAYQRAAQVLDEVAPSCALPWSLLAGIGRVESDHGRHGGSTVGADGLVSPEIVGVPLDGAGPVARIPDTDAGELDGDRRWDRAVGPMQFIPSTWRIAGVDGDGDGVRSPHDLDDAALAAGVYLCSGGVALDNPAGAGVALLRYNADRDYADLVLAYARAYARGGAGSAVAAALPLQALPTLSPVPVVQAGAALGTPVRRTAPARTTTRAAVVPSAASSPRDNPQPTTLTRSPRASVPGSSATPREPAGQAGPTTSTGSPSGSPDGSPDGKPSSGSASPSPSGSTSPSGSSGSPSPSGGDGPSTSPDPTPSGSSSGGSTSGPSPEPTGSTPKDPAPSGSSSDPAGPNPSEPGPEGPDPAGGDPAGSGSPTPAPETTTRSGTWTTCGQGFCLDGDAILVGSESVLAATARADHDGDGAVETNRGELTGLAQGPQPVQVTLRKSQDGPVLTAVGDQAYGA